eukprot:COSAG03_NODE_495_length_7431_cov_96.088048_2_plen_204_part_00
MCGVCGPSLISSARTYSEESQPRGARHSLTGPGGAPPPPTAIWQPPRMPARLPSQCPACGLEVKESRRETSGTRVVYRPYGNTHGRRLSAWSITRCHGLVCHDCVGRSGICIHKGPNPTFEASRPRTALEQCGKVRKSENALELRLRRHRQSTRFPSPTEQRVSCEDGDDGVPSPGRESRRASPITESGSESRRGAAPIGIPY